MNGNFQKTPFFKSIGDAIRSRVGDGNQQKGWCFPCTVVEADGQFVTVKFEIDSEYTIPQVTIPIASSQYVRLPLQPGDPGLAVPADVSLAGVTGQGTTATLTQVANLGALTFVPLGSKTFADVGAAGQLVLYGPGGVLIQDEAGVASIDVTPTGILISIGTISIYAAPSSSPSTSGLTLEVGSSSISITNAGIALTGTTVTINGQDFHSHIHNGVTVGGGNTGPVTP